MSNPAKQYLTVEQMLAWAKRHESSDVAGKVGQSRFCPIYHHLTDCGTLVTHVSVGEFKVEDGEWHELPWWAQCFIEEVDSHYDGTKGEVTITFGDIIEVLESL